METHGLGEETERVGFVTGKAVAEEMLDEWKHQVVPLIIVGMLEKTNGSTICRQFFAPIHFDTFFAGAQGLRQSFEAQDTSKLPVVEFFSYFY